MLKIKNLQVAYSTKIVLKKLNLDVNPGEVCGVLGMNGAGKTTLFKTIYGMLSPVEGQIEYQGKTPKSKEIGYLETENFFYSYMRGDEYLQLLTKDGRYNANLNNIFDLPLNELVDTYSTGMKKRLAFWGVLELNKSLVILDEPFNGVDVESVECFYTLIERMKAAGKTILISSHIIESLTRVCDKIAYLKDGTVQRYYQKEEFENLGIDVRELIKAKVERAFLE